MTPDDSERPKQVMLLVLACISLVAVPIAGSFMRCQDFPPGFPEFPLAHEPIIKPELNWIFFGVACLSAVVIMAFLVVPSWFGFRRQTFAAPRCPRRKQLPIWFWGGTIVNLVSWALMWWGPASVAKYTFIPLWWGFIVAIDGLVYARTAGRSLMATEPRRMVIITLVSIPAWTLFEYINYFGMGFWIYPHNQIFSPTFQTIWFLLSFTTVWPTVFEWYTLLHSVDGLWGRWSDGPRIRISRKACGIGAVIGLLAMLLFAIFPFELFVLLWIGPPIVLIAALSSLGFWTPLRPIEDGNWSPMVLAGLASLANGFFWELWNYGSYQFQAAPNTSNPNYWAYQIPYVGWPEFLSEMPVLGYFGYLPFGVLAWVCWLVAAHLLKEDPDFDLTPGVGGPPEVYVETPKAA